MSRNKKSKKRVRTSERKNKKECWKLPNKRILLFPLALLIFIVLSVSAFKYPFNSESKKTDKTKILTKNTPCKNNSNQKNIVSAFSRPKDLYSNKKKLFIIDDNHDFDSPLSIAKLNLRCAKGLPGAENLDIDKCLSTLQKWSEYIKKETERNLFRYHNNPEHFYNSLAYFKMLVMLTVLYEDFKVEYNKELSEKALRTVLEDFKDNYTDDSRNTFIHGLLSGKRQGSCASMPVLVIALGRLLGYPLKLVPAKCHLFVRWDDRNERINFDVTGGGLQLTNDDFYKKWPFEITQEELKKGFYLKSLSPEEEYAVFLQIRADILAANDEFLKAKRIYRKILEHLPDYPLPAQDNRFSGITWFTKYRMLEKKKREKLNYLTSLYETQTADNSIPQYSPLKSELDVVNNHYENLRKAEIEKLKYFSSNNKIIIQSEIDSINKRYAMNQKFMNEDIIRKHRKRSINNRERFREAMMYNINKENRKKEMELIKCELEGLY